jgi:hypothetical protein
MIHHLYRPASIIPAAGKAVDAICHGMRTALAEAAHLIDEACRLE